ncbi:MAG TPA: MoxR family ATPase, partial [Longimicrobiales bacterium]|nr:MoxR family ATPase [Longimicrobiales bacterium]
QFTSDLLPSDVLGVSIFNPETRQFETRPGPIFTNIVLADEINRAPPRTQSGLLEAMQEGRVTIDDRTYDLPQPFIVLATQNPLEHHGTYPLPESQMDRFLMRLTIGYPDEHWERRILQEQATPSDPLDTLEPVVSPEQVVALQAHAEAVHADPDIIDYVMRLVRATRGDNRIRLGVSPRGAIALLRASRAYALVDGRTFVVPDDVRRLMTPCLAHRLQPTGGTSVEAYDETRVIIEDILDAVEAPV